MKRSTLFLLAAVAALSACSADPTGVQPPASAASHDSGAVGSAGSEQDGSGTGEGRNVGMFGSGS